MLIPTSRNVATVTDMRERALKLLREVKKIGPTYIFYRARPKAVILSIEEYARLMGLLEDYFDAQLAKELEKTPEKGGATIEEVMKKYKIKEPTSVNV